MQSVAVPHAEKASATWGYRPNIERGRSSRSHTNVGNKLEYESDLRRLKIHAQSSWGRLHGFYDWCCCRPSREARPIDMLQMTNPLIANRLHNLSLCDVNMEAQVWRLKIDCIAQYVQTCEIYRRQGDRARCLGNFCNLLMSLAAVLTPLLIGLQGSLGEEVCEVAAATNDTVLNGPGGTPFCFTRQDVDDYIKYTVIALSVVNSCAPPPLAVAPLGPAEMLPRRAPACPTPVRLARCACSVITTLNQVYHFREKGVKRSELAVSLSRDVEDYTTTPQT